MENESKKLLGEVEKLNVLLAKEIKLQSLWRTFLKGFFHSMGWVLGAAFLLAITALLVSKFSGVPILGNILDYIGVVAGRGR